jgi:hypothetical protein
VALTKIQRDVLDVLARRRTASSYVAGAAALNRDGPRISDDLDIFHDLAEEVRIAASADLDALRQSGFDVRVTIDEVGTVEATVGRFGRETTIQWMDETRRRFLPLERDRRFGVRLSTIDLAVNKILAASSRRQARDAVDVAQIAKTLAPLGPLIWAAAAKTTRGPGRIVEDLRRTVTGFSDDELASLRSDPAVEPDAVRSVLTAALDRAASWVERTAPAETLGKLLLDARLRPIEADEGTLASGKAMAHPISDGGAVPAFPPKF